MSKTKSWIIKIFVYLLGVYFFGLSISIYLDLNLGAIHEDVFVFAFINLVGWNHTKDYALGLFILYLIYFVIVFILKAIKIFIWSKKQKVSKQIMKNEALTLLLDLIPLFLWPLSEKFNALFINSQAIGNYSEWIKYWFLWISFICFCLSMSLIVYSTILAGPYNSLSLEIKEIFKINYSICRIIVDVIITAIGIVLIFANNFSFNDNWQNFQNWISLATVIVTFFSGPVINYLVEKFNKIYPLNKVKYDFQVIG